VDVAFQYISPAMVVAIAAPWAVVLVVTTLALWHGRLTRTWFARINLGFALWPVVMLTQFRPEPPGPEINLIPLFTILSVGNPLEGAISTAVAQVIANLLMLVPVGFFGYLSLREPSVWRVLGAVAALAVAIETLQWLRQAGVADVDDVLLAIAGAAVGCGVAVLARQQWRRRTSGVAGEVHRSHP
jgi:glycopeptide antibiotics resistance protein